jgi:hypothetical protein
MEQVIIEILLKLKYHHKWVSYKFIKEEFLKSQYERFNSSTNKHTEHYRYLSFLQIFRDNQSLDDDTINKYIELANLDEDKTMANSALLELLRWQGLTDSQLVKLKEHPLFVHSSFQKIIHKHLTQTELSTIKELTDDKFNFYLSIKDSELHRELINRKDITNEQLKLLQKFGANRVIMNEAKNLLRKKKQKAKPKQ